MCEGGLGVKQSSHFELLKYHVHATCAVHAHLFSSLPDCTFHRVHICLISRVYRVVLRIWL